MNQLNEVVAPTARQRGADIGSHFSTDRRRGLQLALAAVWVFDGLLQYQTYMFSTRFATQILLPSASGNPSWLGDSILWSARIVEADPIFANALFATLELVIGLAIAWRRSLRVGLFVSVAWALLVWWLGEGFGGILSGGASVLSGAPGAALLYALLAVLLWPRRQGGLTSYVAANPVGPMNARVIWLLLWSGLAALNFQPQNLRQESVQSMILGTADGQPAWIAVLIREFAGLSARYEMTLAIFGTVILSAIALGIFLPTQLVRGVVIAALAIAASVWVFGEALGALFGGRGTDVDSGPLLALIALAYWPTKSVLGTSTTPIVGT